MKKSLFLTVPGRRVVSRNPFLGTSELYRLYQRSPLTFIPSLISLIKLLALTVSVTDDTFKLLGSNRWSHRRGRDGRSDRLWGVGDYIGRAEPGR